MSKGSETLLWLFMSVFLIPVLNEHRHRTHLFPLVVFSVGFIFINDGTKINWHLPQVVKKKKQNKLVLIHVWQDFFFSPRYQINWFDTREWNSTFLQWTFSSMYQDKCRLTCNAVSIFFFKKKRKQPTIQNVWIEDNYTISHTNRKKIYKWETKSYTTAESETEDVIVARVNLSGEKNRAQGNWRRLTKYTVEYFLQDVCFYLDSRRCRRSRLNHNCRCFLSLKKNKIQRADFEPDLLKSLTWFIRSLDYLWCILCIHTLECHCVEFLKEKVLHCASSFSKETKTKQSSFFIIWY